MANWFWQNKGVEQGPISSQELRALAAAGRVTPNTLVRKDGSTNWVTASLVKGLFSGPPVGDSPSVNFEPEPSTKGSLFDTAREHASFLMRDLKKLNWKDELIPLNETNLRALLRDYLFWTVLIAGVLPQLIGTVNNENAQLDLYSLLFAAVWGVVFRDLIIRSPVKWSWLIAAACFTGMIGTSGMLMLGNLLPHGYIHMSNSPSISISLLGFVIQTGVMEELCKAIPVLAYLLIMRRNAEPLTAILIGVFSGLGFAASENIVSGQGEHLHAFGMLRLLLRSLSTVLGHAVLTGIVAYFLVMAFTTKRRAPVLAIVGFGLAALLHGTYDWLLGLQPTLATFVDVAAFTLFYGYVINLRSLVDVNRSPPSNAQSDGRTPRSPVRRASPANEVTSAANS